MAEENASPDNGGSVAPTVEGTVAGTENNSPSNEPSEAEKAVATLSEHVRESADFGFFDAWFDRRTVRRSRAAA